MSGRSTPWTFDRKKEACIRAPLQRELVRADTRIVERPGWFQVMTPSAPGTVLNEVVLSRVDAADADRVIDETVAAYAADGHPTKWCVGEWTAPEDFGARLTARGFSSWDVRGMGCETTLALAASDAVRVEQVTESTVDAYVATMMRGWSLPLSTFDAERAVHLAALLQNDEHRGPRFFIARIDGAVVGTAWLSLRDDHAYLLGTQVLEAARGLGAYRALVAARLAFLRERGIAYAVTHAREATSAPMLERFGFETLFRSKCYLKPAPPQT